MTYDERNIPIFEDEDYLDMPKYSIDLKSALNKEFDKIPQIILQQKIDNRAIFSNAIKQKKEKSDNIDFYSTGSYLENINVYGKSTQEIRTGINLLNIDSNITIKGSQTFETNLEIGKTYTIKIEDIVTDNIDNSSFVFGLRGENNSYIQDVRINYTTRKTTIKPTKEVKAIKLYSGYDNTNSLSTTTTFTNVMIYEGTEEKQYEKYGIAPSIKYPSNINSINEISYNSKDENGNNFYLENRKIVLPSHIELCAIEDIQDYMDNNGVIHKKLKKYELGTQNWTVYQSPKNTDRYYCSTKAFDTLVKQYDKGNTNFMCNIASSIASLWDAVVVDKDTFNISIITTDKVRFMIKKTDIDGQEGSNLSEKFNNLLLSKSAYFIAEMPVEDTSNLLDGLEKEKLEKMGTFIGKNTITTNTPISFTYNLDTNNLLERIEALENKINTLLNQQESEV